MSLLATTLEAIGPDGRKVRVAQLGSGDSTPVVLLHGYPDNLQIWSNLAPRLAARRPVVAFDWPGMGQSEPWPGGATPAHQADRLIALLDAWGLDRVDLVGHDMGAQPALVAAARHPDRVRRMVAMNALAIDDAATSWEIRLLRRYGWNRVILRRLPHIVFRRAERTMLPRGIRLPADLRDDLWASFRRPEVRAFVAKLCAGYQGTLPRLPDDYARIAVPTLVLWGGRDRHFPIAQARGLHAAVCGSTLEILEGAEHWMAWYRAEEVAARIARFLSDPLPPGEGGGAAAG